MEGGFKAHSARLQERLARAEKAHRAQVVRGMARTLMVQEKSMRLDQVAEAAPCAIKHAAAIYDAIAAAEVPDAA